MRHSSHVNTQRLREHENGQKLRTEPLDQKGGHDHLRLRLRLRLSLSLSLSAAIHKSLCSPSGAFARSVEERNTNGLIWQHLFPEVNLLPRVYLHNYRRHLALLWW